MVRISTNIQKNESLLWKVAGILGSSVEKVDKTAEKIVKDLKKANSLNRKLIKELSTKEKQSIQKKEWITFQVIKIIMFLYIFVKV